MFTIPATVLGTKHDVVCTEDPSNMLNVAVFGLSSLPPHKFAAYGKLDVADLKQWISSFTAIERDEIDSMILASMDYRSLETDWLGTVHNSQTPASAFKVGDLVIWNPPVGRTPSSILIVGATYKILSCTWPGPPAVWSLGYYNGNTHLEVADEDELTLYGVNTAIHVASQTTQSTQQLPLPLGTTTGITGTGIVVPYVKKCECGAAKCKSNIHSDWCPMYNP